MEEAYLRAKDTSFRHNPGCKKFRDTLAKCSDESCAWPVLDAETVKELEEAPEAGPAPEAAPAPAGEGLADAVMEPAAPVMEPAAPEAEERTEEPAVATVRGISVATVVSRFTKVVEASRSWAGVPGPSGPGTAGRA